MTRKEQNKILDDKIKANNAQYKVDRLNAEISAFSSDDLNKCEFLTRKDLKYKPNALDKARFEFSPLGKAFKTGLNKTVQGYKEEGVIKLLKDIRDGLRGGVNRLDDDRPDKPDDRPDRPDNRLDIPDNNDGDDNNDKISEYQEVINSLLEEINNKKYNNDDNNDYNKRYNNVAPGSVFSNNLNNLNNEISNVKSDGEYYARLIAYQNATIEKLKKSLQIEKI